MEIYDFNGYKNTNEAYGGMAGQKHGVFIGDERWIIKYPVTTERMSE